MVDFRPLQGLEYNSEKAGELSRLLSPPYDVVDEKLRLELEGRSPYNVVRIILPRSTNEADRYEAAAALLEQWVSEGVFSRSPDAFYVLEQRFVVDGGEHLRTSLLGRMRIGPWRESGVYPHEVTLPKPKADRLNLYRATHMQPGPVFALFEDRESAVSALLEKEKQAEPWRTADGPEGAHDRIWKITDEGAISRLERAIAGDRFYIADGHHRYETALAYRGEIAAGGGLAPDHAANFVLTAAVPFSDPGLAILPTHRLVKFDRGVDVAKAVERLRDEYEIEETASVDEGNLAGGSGPGIALYAAKRYYLLRLKPLAREVLNEEAGELMACMNVYEVRHRVLTHFFSDVDLAADEEHISYTHDVAEAIGKVDAGDCDMAVLLAPLSVSAMAAVASEGRIMPPKSTFFYPKVPTGIVLNSLW